MQTHAHAHISLYLNQRYLHQDGNIATSMHKILVGSTDILYFSFLENGYKL